MPKPIPTPIGIWTARKLEYLQSYLQGYARASKRAGETYYLDLFAGCGDCIIRKTRWAVEGSPWRAVKVQPPFTKLFFIEKDPRLAKYLCDSLKRKSVQNAEVFIGDCNGPILDEVLGRVPREKPSFAFLDPSGLQLHWNTVVKLASHRIGPRKMELLIVYPYDMAIKRVLGSRKAENALTTFYGGSEWQQEAQESKECGESPKKRRERFVELYKRKLQELGYKHVDDYGPMGVGRRYYYNVIFASDHPVGAKIMRDVWSKLRKVPGELL